MRPGVQPITPDALGRSIQAVAAAEPDGPRGLLVDVVAGVVRLPRGALEPCPHGLGGANADLLSGIGHDRDRLFTVLDLGALLRRAPALPAEGRALAERT